MTEAETGMMCFEEEAGRDHKSRIQAATEG